MHREIQIKQFPIVTTHWWPKTRNERFVWENNSIYIVFTSCTQPCPSDLSGCVCARWRRACLKRGADATFQAPTEASANQIASCKYPISFMQHQRSMWLVVVTMTARQHHASDTPSVSARTHVTHTHTRHTPDVCALRSLGHGCVQKVKNDINTVRFLTQTARFVS